MKQANRRPASGRRIGRPASDAFVLVAAATAVVVLLVLAIAVVNREDASRAADDARVAILAEGTLSAASAVENAASQVLLAVTITDANDVGTNDVVATSLAVVDRTANELDRRLDVFVAELPNEQAAATRAVATLDAATGALIDASARGSPSNGSGCCETHRRMSSWSTSSWRHGTGMSRTFSSQDRASGGLPARSGSWSSSSFR